MRALSLVVIAWSSVCFAQATTYGVGSGRPSVAEARKAMAIPSTDTVRGQLDATGYASTAEAMARVWEASAQPPQPAALATAPAGVYGVLGPHDDYVYAGRIDRALYPLVTAKTVVIVGVFHRYQKFGAHDQLIFDDYRAWRSPDGDIRVSPLREDLLKALPASEAIRDDSAHDAEHSVEAIAYFLKHARPDVEIIPIIIPAAQFSRLSIMADHLSVALATSMKRRGLALGKDVAIVISTDGTHYGGDFSYVPFGAGGVDAYQKALAQDRALVSETLEGPLTAAKAQKFAATVVNPDRVDEYRVSWCGRFSVPFGLRVLAETARHLRLPPPTGIAIALGASVDTPALKVTTAGLGATAPANLYHFVFHPGVAFVPGAR